VGHRPRLSKAGVNGRLAFGYDITKWPPYLRAKYSLDSEEEDEWTDTSDDGPADE
jgi:hypothetical protein